VVVVVVAVKIAEVRSGCLFDAIILMRILIAPIAILRVLLLLLLPPHPHPHPRLPPRYLNQQRQTMFRQLLVLHRQRSLVKQKLLPNKIK
jgi:hypothetical protein